MDAHLASRQPVSLIDELLSGAIDLHHHGYPEFSLSARTRFEDAEEFSLSRDAGMAAVVLKSHMWPTVGRAYHLARLVPGIEIIPSLTMNTIAGGFSPIAVESAALQGARVLFMPTWSARNDIEKGGFSKEAGKFLSRAANPRVEDGLTALDESGAIRGELKECLAVAAEFAMVLCTAHIAPAESLKLADYARQIGIEEIVFSHPDSRSVGATREQIRDMAALGAYCEFCVIGALPAIQRLGPKQILATMDDIGADRIIVTTDYFYEWFPPGAEMIRMMIGTLLAAGVSAEEVSRMVRRNPETLLRRSRELRPNP